MREERNVAMLLSLMPRAPARSVNVRICPSTATGNVALLVSLMGGPAGTPIGAGVTFAVGWPCAGRSVVMNRGQLPAAGVVSLVVAGVR
jgi:hypothetical protein